MVLFKEICPRDHSSFLMLINRTTSVADCTRNKLITIIRSRGISNNKTSSSSAIKRSSLITTVNSYIKYSKIWLWISKLVISNNSRISQLILKKCYSRTHGLKISVKQMKTYFYNWEIVNELWVWIILHL